MNTAVVVFDLGMVLSTPMGLYEGIGRLLGVSPAEAEAGFWGPHRHAYDEGISDREFWERALPLIPAAQVEDLEALLPELIDVDVTSWRTPRPASRAILHRLHEGGVTTAVLSNAPRVFAQAAPGFDWRSLVDHWFFSAEIGIAKPDAGIYSAVETALDRRPDQLWFIDDKQVNVDAAAARGWHSHLWVDDADTAAWLTAEGFLTGAPAEATV